MIGLTLKEGQTKPAADEWGTISAWAWGLSRTIDYFETDKSVNAKQIAITGASRLGKTVLWASAQDERVAAVFAVGSGRDGCVADPPRLGRDARRHGRELRLSVRRQPPEVGRQVERSARGSAHADRPVRTAPGLRQRRADGPVERSQGQFLAMVAAGPVYRLLGAKDLGVTELPALDTPVTDGDLAFHYHSGGHTVLPADWKTFFEFADRHYKAATKKQPGGGSIK